MKKCPFCAEEILDEAIKCRYCQSFLSQAPSSDDNTAAPAARPAAKKPLAPATRYTEKDEARDRRILYQGSPSWRAYLREYAGVVFFAIAGPVSAFFICRSIAASGSAYALSMAVPVVIAAVALFVLNLYRRSKVFRVTTTNIETEFGLLTKRIDVLELWRCRDVRYRQSIFDRVLGIAHIEIFTADVTTPNLCLLGFPASRQLFENIRDSIEIQRQARNVVGFVQ